MAWVGFILGFMDTCACVLVEEGFLALWWAALCEVVCFGVSWEAYLLTIGFVFLSSLLFGWGILHGVLPGLGYRWRSSREFSLINTPWGQEFSGSAVFQTQSSHATGSGLISGQKTNQRLQGWLPPACDSAAAPCTHWLPRFPPKAFPATISSHSLGPCPHSQQQSSPWDCSPVPVLQRPTAARSSGLAYVTRVCRAAAQIIYVTLTPFRLSQISSSTLQQPSPWFQSIASKWWSCPCFQLPHTLGAGPVCSLFSSFSLPSCILLRFAWIYILLSGGQGLLPVLSWCCARSASEGVFLMQ